jgi:hypothetical protein
VLGCGPLVPVTYTLYWDVLDLQDGLRGPALVSEPHIGSESLVQLKPDPVGFTWITASGKFFHGGPHLSQVIAECLPNVGINGNGVGRNMNRCSTRYVVLVGPQLVTIMGSLVVALVC